MKQERSCGLAQASYTVYLVRVVNGSQSWVAEKRYSDFEVLDQVIDTLSFELLAVAKRRVILG